MDNQTILRLFDGARVLCIDVEEAIELVCVITKSTEDKVSGILSDRGVYVIRGSSQERAIRNYIIENDGIMSDDALAKAVSLRFCLCEEEAARLVEKWIGFPGGGINERG